MAETNDLPARHVWTEAQMRKALTDLVKAATGRKSDFMLNVPRHPDDADCVIGDLIREVLTYRAGRERLETVEQVLTRLVSFYDERHQVSRKAAALMEKNPSMQLHYSLDAYGFVLKASAVRAVAECLEILLPAPAEREGRGVPGVDPPFTRHIYPDGGLELHSLKPTQQEEGNEDEQQS